MMSSNSILKTLNSQWKENDEQATIHKKKVGGQPSSSPSSSKRKILHSNRPALSGKENVKRKMKPGSIKSFFSETQNVSTDKKRKLVIYDETTQVSKKCKTTSTQTSIADEVNELMCSDDPTEKYWELLAEERRKALSDALDENKKLADEIESKDELIDDMKSDIERLEETASHAQYLASVIEELSQGCCDDVETADAKAASSNSSTNIVEECSSDECKEKSLNTTDGNDQFNGNSPDLSDGSCSHDSDKENKPVLGLPQASDSSD